MTIKIEDFINMQEELYECNKDEWNPLHPQYAKDSILWMIEEVGEVISIIKKKGHDEIVNNPDVRHHFTEEMVDILFYFNQALLRMGITAQEITDVAHEKHQRNMKRNFKSEYKEK